MHFLDIRRFRIIIDRLRSVYAYKGAIALADRTTRNIFAAFQAAHLVPTRHYHAINLIGAAQDTLKETSVKILNYIAKQ